MRKQLLYLGLVGLMLPFFAFRNPSVGQQDKPKEKGFKKIALATDPFQSKTLAGMIKKLELPIDLIPINFDTLRTINRPEPSINPQMTVSESFVSIKERESFFTRFQGTMGKQIMFHEEDLPKKKVRKYKRQGRVIETKK